ncbi:hypothetical protein GIB67_000379 [Kingdonia uniflora]|uniref:Dynamin GTPase n=1 Tax=Kingdonia uniflora TaxID=39325 RepID=A0A7J7P7D9_9MAGN|nr:hypothetical protein GIB67_000379 [Kingdonia uniflora]
MPIQSSKLLDDSSSSCPIFVLQDKSQVVEDALVRLGEQMAHTMKVQELSLWSFAGNLRIDFYNILLLVRVAGGKSLRVLRKLPNRIKQLPLDRHLTSTMSKGMMGINHILYLQKKVHRVLVDIVSAAANATPGLGRYPPFKRETPRGRGDGGGSFGSSNRLYAGNLSWGVDDLALETLFSEQGKVLEAKVVYDRETDRSTFQSGFITCNSTEEMNNAISSLDGVDLDACDWGLKVLIVVDEIGEGHESSWVTCGLDILSKLGIEEITGALGDNSHLINIWVVSWHLIGIWWLVRSESFRFGLVAFGLAIDMAFDFWLLCSSAAYSNWMDRQRREEEQKGRTSRKGHEAEQAVLNRATSPQTGSQQTGGTLKQLKDKISPPEKDTQEGSALKTVGPSGEITAGFLLKKSSKTNGWSRRWFVLNEKSGKECNVEEIPDEEPPSKGSKDKKGNASDSGKVPNLMFKITSKVPYKTVLKAHNAVLLKAESVADKVEWVSKIRNVIQPSMGAQGKSGSSTDAGLPMRQSLSDGSLDTMARRPADPEEELRWMSQEVRGYVEAVLNSLAANVPKAVVLCQVEKAKEDMLNQLYSSIRIEELLLEDQNVKRRRERFQKQSSILSKLARQLSIHDNRAAAASSWSDDGVGEAESSPRNGVPSDDWRSAFNAAANGNNSSYSRSSSNGHSRRYGGDATLFETPEVSLRRRASKSNASRLPDDSSNLLVRKKSTTSPSKCS